MIRISSADSRISEDALHKCHVTLAGTIVRDKDQIRHFYPDYIVISERHNSVGQ